MLKFIATSAAVMLLAGAGVGGAAAQDSDDPFLWLEDVEGDAALDWVRARNAESLAELEADPNFAPMYEEAKAILTSTARIPDGQIHNGAVYNFWQDDAHVRGVWRRASVDSYRSGEPEWETLIDFDALAEQEGENWIHGDIACLSPEYRHCMIEMSYGGKDAAVWREFDTSAKEFVEDGFVTPEAKTWLNWYDADTLFVGTDWGPETQTQSGYPTQVRIWRRGANLDEAELYFEGAREDVATFPRVEHDGDNTYIIAQRGVSFFDTEYHVASGLDAKSSKLPLPTATDLFGVLDGRAIFLLRAPWSYGGADYAVGDVVAYNLASDDAELVISPAANEAIDDGSIDIGKSGLVLRYLDDVSGRAARLARTKSGKWKKKDIVLPDNGVVKVISAGGGTDDILLTYESLTTPNALYFVGKNNKAQEIMRAPAFYDATGVVVEQRFATSKDGAKVPYYIMGKDAVLKAGNAPTVQYGYGGFLNPILPVYYEDPGRPQHGALAGKMWVSRGGVLVLSNIRGGSEYGPAWHAAALKENRQRAFDDFIAISEDLIATGVTSEEKLGAIGRSNGGLLMGAMLTQRPDLYAAMDIGVPLLDMKRYNKMLAGASWMGEYGNPDIPEEWAYISQYSPYQNLKADQPYPKVLLYTSTKDDRVHPGHARKAAAKLASLGYPFFYYENIEGGHGGTANQDQLAFRTALEWVYFAHMLMGAE